MRRAPLSTWSLPLWLPLAASGWVLTAFAGSYVPLGWLLRPLLVATIPALVVAILIGPRLPWLSPRLNLIGSLWFGIAILSFPFSLIVSTPLVTLPVTLAPTSKPSIYLILLDGYARADTLASFGYDNRPFLKELSRRGFDIAARSTSPYLRTTQVLASILTFRHIDELGMERLPDRVGQRRILRQVIASAPVFGTLRAAGYQIVSLPGPGAEIDVHGDITYADSRLNEFERSLLHQSGIDRLVDAVDPAFFARVHRERIESQFAMLQTLAIGGQTFVFAHIMAPHAPFVFNADGTPAQPPECFPVDCLLGASSIQALGITSHEFAERYAANVAGLNRQVLQTIDAIQARDPRTVIAVISDHGSRFDEAEHAEWHRNLVAIAMPGHRGEVPDDTRSVDVLPLIFETYLGAPHYRLDWATFDDGPGGPMDVRRIVGSR